MIFLIIWFVCGLITAGWIFYLTCTENKEVTVGDICKIIFSFILGILGLIALIAIYLVDHVDWDEVLNKVIIKFK